MLLLLLLRVVLVATAPPAPPASATSNMPSALSRGVFPVPNFLSKPSASSTLKTPLPPLTQPLSATERTPMSSRASITLSVSKLYSSPLPSTSKLSGESTLARQSSLARESPSVQPVDRLPTLHIAFPTKPLMSLNRKPPPVAKLSQYLKEPSVFGPDSSDLDFQQHAVQERDFGRLSTQRGNSTQRDELLLEELKRVLQQNNEDYLERTRPDIVFEERRMFHGRDRKRLRHHERTRSTDQDEWGGVAPPGGPDGLMVNPATAARRAGPRERDNTGLLTVSLPSGDPAASGAPSLRESDKHRKQKKAKNHLKRFMAFVKKNRALLKAFIQEKRSGRGAQGPRKHEAEQGAEGGSGPWAGQQGAEAVPRTRSEAFLRGLMGEVLKATRALVPVQLDLSPGRGERIEKMRIKGRICQRNVMKPEGPKYDSRGSTYLPEFIDSLRKKYDVTKKKDFVLPICCNCCKKSVLGCE